MLLSFGGKNFFGFKEPFHVSFTLNGNASFPAPDHDFVRTLCIKGANASGKTNLLKALSFLKHLMHDSQTDKEGVVLVSPYYNSDEPVEMYLEFTTKQAQYRYEVVCNKKVILEEGLKRRPVDKERMLNIVTRKGRTLEAKGDFKKLNKLLIKENASFLSAASNLLPSDKNPLNDVAQFCSTIRSNVSYLGYADIISAHGKDALNEISKTYYQNKSLRIRLIKFLKKCDTGIGDVKLAESVDAGGEKKYFPVFIHPTQDGEFGISFDIESSGTQKLFMDSLGLFLSLEEGGVLIADELDSKLHPALIEYIIDFYNDKDINPNGSQLIFTTHHTNIMEKMTKYRTYLVNKEDNECYGYRLDEVSGLRSDKALPRLYREKKIGGVPNVKK